MKLLRKVDHCIWIAEMIMENFLKSILYSVNKIIYVKDIICHRMLFDCACVLSNEQVRLNMNRIEKPHTN